MDGLATPELPHAGASNHLSGAEVGVQGEELEPIRLSGLSGQCVCVCVYLSFQLRGWLDRASRAPTALPLRGPSRNPGRTGSSLGGCGMLSPRRRAAPNSRRTSDARAERPCWTGGAGAAARGA